MSEDRAEYANGDYRCFAGCGASFDSLDDMEAVEGKGNRSPRHFCTDCADRLRRGPPIMTDGGRVESADEDQHGKRTETVHYAACRDCDLYKWCHRALDAKEAAEEHSTVYDHESFNGSTEVELA